MKKLPISTGQKVLIADGQLTEEEFAFYGLKVDSVGTVVRTADDSEITEQERKQSESAYVPHLFTAAQKKNGWAYAVRFGDRLLPIFFKKDDLVAAEG